MIRDLVDYVVDVLADPVFWCGIALAAFGIGLVVLGQGR